MTRCAGADLCRFICVLLCISEVTKAVHIEKFEVPAIAAEGDSPVLTCFHSLDPEEPEKALVVKWWWLPLEDAEDRRVIYQRIAGHEPQTLKEGIDIRDDDTIVLVSVAPRDSGTYECEVSIIEEDRKSQRLIVHTEGTGPELNTTLLQDDDGNNEAVLVDCGAFNVSPQPELVMSVNDVIYLNDSQSLSPVIDGRYNVTATISVPIENFTGEIICNMTYIQHQEVQNLYYPTNLSTADVLKSLQDALRAEKAIHPPKKKPPRKPMRLLKLDIPEMISANQLPSGELNEYGVERLTTVRPRTSAPPPHTTGRFSTLDISSEVIASAEALKPGLVSNAISIRNTAVLTALVTLLMSLLL